MKNKKILIIGGFGFLGLNLFKRLHNNYDVTLGIKKSSIKPNINLPNRIKTIFTDNDDFLAVLRNVKFDTIINCAVDYGFDNDYKKVNYLNVDFQFEIIEQIQNTDTLYICFDTFYTKFHNYSYLSNYINSKIEFKDKCKSIRSTKIINLQLEHIYGSFDAPNKFISFLIKNFKIDANIDLTSCEQKRDFLHVNDLTELVETLILKTNIKKAYHHFEVGTGKSIALKQFIIEAKKIFKTKSKLNFGVKPMRENEIMNSYALLNRINDFCEWTPSIHYKEGIKMLFEK